MAENSVAISEGALNLGIIACQTFISILNTNACILLMHDVFSDRAIRTLHVLLTKHLRPSGDGEVRESACWHYGVELRNSYFAEKLNEMKTTAEVTVPCMSMLFCSYLAF